MSEVARPGTHPRGLAAWLALCAGIPIAFWLTGPWRIAGRDVGRLSVGLGAGLLLLAVALAAPSWRERLLAAWRRGLPPVPTRTLALAAALAGVFLFRILLGRYLALEVDAWDTTLFFDQPIAATLSGRPLDCAYLGRSYLSIHASWILFAFVPPYAVVATPVWLLAAMAVALGGGAAIGFLAFRRILRDDLAAALFAAAFLLNPYTAKTLQYGFHPEAFYPAAAFLLWLGLVDDRPELLGAGVLVAVSVKEDAAVLLVGFALAAVIVRRRFGVAAAVAGAGVAALVVDVGLVMPAMAGGPAARPWYANYWSSWGDSLPGAALAMIRDPLRLAGSVARSGAPHLLEPLLVLPLAGPEGLVAALPGLALYGAADFRALREFALYYAMPVLPYLFVGSAYAVARLARRVSGRRALALLLLLACAFDGAGYSLRRPHPARRELSAALDALGDRPARLQGSLYPHAGDASTRRVLDRSPVPPSEAVFLAPGTDPFPFTAEELGALARRLADDPSRERRETPGGLVVFVPRPRGAQ